MLLPSMDSNIWSVSFWLEFKVARIILNTHGSLHKEAEVIINCVSVDRDEMSMPMHIWGRVSSLLLLLLRRCIGVDWGVLEIFFYK